MELQVQKQIPQKVSWNYAEIKAALLEKVAYYNTVVYDETQEKAAKSDKAELNKLKKALNDERIRQEKEYMIPFNEFKGQVKELCDIIDSSVKSIDSQVKKFDDDRKAKKRIEAQQVFEFNNDIGWLTFEQIFNPKWLNASTTLISIKQEIVERIEQIKKEIATLEHIEYSDVAIAAYKNYLDLTAAVNEAQRIAQYEKARKIREEELAKQKMAEVDVVPVEPVPVNKSLPTKDIVFKLKGINVEQAKAVDIFLRTNGIDYEVIR